MKPHEGELNYKLFDKNPIKFYDKVFSQDVTKHKVREDKEIKANIDEKRKKKEEELGHAIRKKKAKAPLTVYSKVTKRPNSKIY